MSPDSRMMMLPIPGPDSILASQPRRVAPMTSWVALTECAKSMRVTGMSLPTSWWKVPPRVVTS